MINMLDFISVVNFKDILQVTFRHFHKNIYEKTEIFS